MPTATPLSRRPHLHALGTHTTPASPPAGRSALLDVVGDDLLVPLVPHGTARLVHLDYAASAPPLRRVADAIADFLPWYASVHRGAGFNSTVSSEAVAAARAEVAAFLGARADDVVVFTRNTTDSLNLLAGTLPADTTVITLDLEHHANLLPWRRRGGTTTVVHLPTPRSTRALPALFAAALAEVRTEHAVVAITGASNVTGEILPVAAITAVAHTHGARVVLDAAQLAPHRAVDITALGVDYVAFSGHKAYAPYGAGALVGRRDWLDQAPPHLAGGGAVAAVSVDDVAWLPAPNRHEGGTPNVLGAVAIAAACRALTAVGLARVEQHDAELTAHLSTRLAELPVRVLNAFDDADIVGIVTLTFDRSGTFDRSAAEVAAALSAEHGVATRDGAFCAHPLMRRLAGAGPADPVPNALRVSVGVGSSIADVDTFADALGEILHDGPRSAYTLVDGRLSPTPDTRPRPALPAAVVAR